MRNAFYYILFPYKIFTVTRKAEAETHAQPAISLSLLVRKRSIDHAADADDDGGSHPCRVYFLFVVKRFVNVQSARSADKVMCCVCIYILSSCSADWASTSTVTNPSCGTASLLHRFTGKMIFSLFPSAPENLISRDGFGRPVPHHPGYCSHSG